MLQTVSTALAIGAICLVSAQTASTSRTVSGGGPKTLRGLLMDASCAAIRSPAAASSADGETAKGRTDAGQLTTVREKYAECRATPATTTFAIHANGKLYVLDERSNRIVRQQMGNEAFRAAFINENGSPKWISVTVTGAPTSEGQLSIESIRK